MLANGIRQDPPPVLGARHRQPERQRALEEVLVACQGGEELAVEQWWRRDPREQRTVGRRRGQRLSEDRGHRVALAGADAGDGADGPFTLLGPCGGEDRRGGPAARCGVEQSPVLHRGVKSESVPAECERLLRAQRQVGRGQHERRRAAHAVQPRGQVAGEDHEPRGVRQLACDPIDQRRRLGVRVMGVVDHDRARLLDDAAEHCVDRARRIVADRSHRASRIAEPGRRHCRAQPRRQQPARHAAGLEQHPDRERAPQIDELGGEHRFPVAPGRLDDDDRALGADLRQPGAADVMRR